MAKYEKELRVLELLKFKVNRKKAHRFIADKAGCSHMYVGNIRRDMGLMPFFRPRDEGTEPEAMALRLLEIMGTLRDATRILNAMNRKHEMSKTKIAARIKEIKRIIKDTARIKELRAGLRK